MKEVWKDISELEAKYEVSNFGRVRNKTRGNIIKPTLQPPTSSRNSNTRYEKIPLGRYERRWLHRVVALAHVDNPENKPQVDHIDGNGRNNRADNLRWVTQSENMSNNNTIKRSKNVKLVQGRTYAEISRELGDKNGHIVSKRLKRGWCVYCATTVKNTGMGGSRKVSICNH